MSLLCIACFFFLNIIIENVQLVHFAHTRQIDEHLFILCAFVLLLFQIQAVRRLITTFHIYIIVIEEKILIEKILKNINTYRKKRAIVHNLIERQNFNQTITAATATIRKCFRIK